MVRLWLVVGVIAAVFYIYSIVDTALIEHSRVRALPKAAWLAIVIIFPLIGGVLWFLFGRARRGAVTRSRVIAPDDDPEFLGSIGRSRVKNTKQTRDEAERIRQMEKDLAELDETKNKNGDTDHPGRLDA
jgi:cbb3-type cytochrome oxidase subunit 3